LPSQESLTQGYWEVDDPPDPTVAQTSTEFLAELEVQLRFSQLSVTDIEHRVRAYGGYVPEGIVSSTLRGNALPGEELLVQLLWAVGCDDETVELWLWARERLAAEGSPFDPTEVLWVPDESTKYAEGSLAQAIEERRDQGGWRGLHRHAITDGGDAKYAPKRLRSKGSDRAAAGRSDWSSRALIGLVGVGVVALAAGAFAALSGGDEVASPPAAGAPVCCPESPSPGSQTPTATPESELPVGPPLPSTGTKPTISTTPRPSATTRGPQPSTTTQAPPAPRLTGSGNATCASQSGTWVVTVVLTANLTDAASGTDPQGRAGQGGSMNSFALTGTGTSFSGQTTVEAGPDSARVDGTIEWSVTVTVPGVGNVGDNGSKSFTCGS
jgi:hypothetical protein